MYKNGGYAIVSHDDANIYSKVQGAYANQKPILFYDDDNTCYFIDTIKKNDDGDYVLTKGGKTFTITDANSVIAEGIVSNTTMENIVDLDDNKRFIEVNASDEVITEGTTIEYAKASLSGTHLMLVVAGTIDNGVELVNLQERFTLPSWIMNKIFPVWSKYIESKTITAYATDWSNQTFNVALEKYSDTQLRILKTGTAVTLTDDRSFRVQFDLLIDAE